MFLSSISGRGCRLGIISSLMFDGSCQWNSLEFSFFEGFKPKICCLVDIWGIYFNWFYFSSFFSVSFISVMSFITFSLLAVDLFCYFFFWRWKLRWFFFNLPFVMKTFNALHFLLNTTLAASSKFSACFLNPISDSFDLLLAFSFFAWLVYSLFLNLGQNFSHILAKSVKCLPGFLLLCRPWFLIFVSKYLTIIKIQLFSLLSTAFPCLFQLSLK